MGRLRFRLSVILITLLLYGNGCVEHTKQRTIDNQIFDDLIYELLDTLVIEHQLKGAKIIHYEIYPDKLKKEILSSTINELSRDTTVKAKLIRGLGSIVQDTVILSLSRRSREDYEFVYDSIGAREEIEKDDPNNVLLSLSPISLTEDGSVGCFYTAVNCGKLCSSGYYVFVKKYGNKWAIRAIIRNWHSQNFKGNI